MNGPVEHVIPQMDYESTGGQLAAARQHYGLAVADVARQLKLNVRQVEALEEDAYEQLPGPVFVRGFVRNYARFLGLDPEPLLAYAEHHMPRQRPVDEPFSPSRAVPFSGERENHLSRYMIVIVLLIAGVLVFELYHYKPQHIAEKTLFEPGRLREAPPPARKPAIAPAQLAKTAPAGAAATPPAATSQGAPAADSGAAPAAGAESPAAADGSGAAAAPAAAAPNQADAAASNADNGTTASPQTQPAASDSAAAPGAAPAAAAAAPAQAALPFGEKQLHLVFHKDSWVEVHDKAGKRIFSKLNPAGTEQTITGTPPFSLVIGNAAGVTLTYGGKPVDLAPHTKTTVARFTLE
ncbi:MAG TPA: helix-turn-helix domain-containing protein [Burkholderiales bacterium]|jgi:cytoskeleton protein RodZ|nr:helix-turn-helix domain-containing protein [Burkholderiales bacterium]